MKATFAAGCFWGIEEVFRHVEGVWSTRVGYIGGRIGNPTYEEVCTGTSGHVEAVEVQFDPAAITYEALLDLFWRMHDPTSFNDQGPGEIGEQYGAVIFCHSVEQQASAEASLRRVESANTSGRPVVTQIRPAARFWPAEEQHQEYIWKGGSHSCNVFKRGFDPGKPPEISTE